MAQLCKIISILLIFFTSIYTQPHHVQFDHITTEDGLSHNRVNAILRDSRGFMWFGTKDGLNRYDGYDFKVYKYNPLDSNSISGNFISSIYEDREGMLWIGTGYNGFNILNRKSNKFRRYKFDVSLYPQSKINAINLFFEDPADSIRVMWIGCGSALLKYIQDAKININRESYYLETSRIIKEISGRQGLFIHYHMNPEDSTSISQKPWKNIIQDTKGRLWFGTPIGLDAFNKETEIFNNYFHDPKDSGSIGSNIVFGVYEDEQGFIWVATEGGGLNKFDPKSGKFTRYQHDPDDPNSIGSDYIHEVYGDKSGRLWVVTGGGGFYQFDKISEKFYCYKKEPGPYSRIGRHFKGEVYLDDTGKHWLGTANDGIYKCDLSRNDFKTHLLNAENSQIVDIRAIFKDSRGTLWVSSNHALYRWDTKSDKYRCDRYDRNHPNKLLRHSITTFHQHDDFLWLGTEEGGIKRYHLKTGSIINVPLKWEENYPRDRRWYSFIRKCEEDRQGNLIFISYAGSHWLLNKNSLETENLGIKMQGANLLVDSFGEYWSGDWGRGIFRFKGIKEDYMFYLHDTEDPSSLSSNYINTIYEDKKTRLWIGTNNGLNLFDREDETFKSYSREDGLASDHILSILEDAAGNLWLCTPLGITRFSLQQRDGTGLPLIKNYRIDEAIQFYADEICYKDQDGIIYFGGKNGFISFHPESIKGNVHVPKIVITEFKLFNEPVKVGVRGQSPLQNDISETEEIILPYDQNFFSFEFAALDYTDPRFNKYAFKMEGIDREILCLSRGG